MKYWKSSCFLLIFHFTCAVSLAEQTGPGVALVLSGGGARGGAHVGVLEVLEEEGVPIDLIVGTSFGALVGSLYSVGYTARDIRLILERVDWNELFDDVPDRRLLNWESKARLDRRMFELAVEDFELRLPTGLQAGQKITQLLDRLTAYPALEAGNDFDRLSIPFRAVATDILSGRAHVFDGGSVSRAVRASIAVPGLFTPVEMGDELLLDGGLANNLPVDVARALGARVVIAVDVSTPLRNRKDQIRSILDILDQAISIHIEEHKQRNLELADVIVAPDLESFSASDFSRIQEMLPRGQAAARDALPSLRAALRRASIPPASAPTRVPLLNPATFDLARYQVSNRILRPDRVEIEGLEKHPELAEEVRRSARIITLNRIDRRVSRLYGTDRFRAVNYLLKEDRGQTVLSYRFEEAPATQLGLGIRYDRDFNFTGSVELLSRDLRGSPNDLALRALIGNVKLAQLDLMNRSLAKGLVFFSPSVYARSFERNVFLGDRPLGDFEDRRSGFRLAAVRPLGNSARLEAAYHFDRVDLEGVLGDQRQAGPESLAGIEVAFELDTQDHADFPATGWKAHLSADVLASSLGGDFSFRRFRAEGVRHFSPGPRSAIGVSGRWGLVEGDVPVYEEFFTGGAHYFSFVAAPFVGLDRGQQRSRQLLNLGLEYRRNWKTFQLGFLERIDWGVKYHTGIFSQEARLLQFQQLLHGVGGGIYFETRFLGPIILEMGGTSQGDFNTYVSVGHFF